MDTPWHLYLMAGLYIAAGTMHFVKPKIYLHIMPRYLPHPKLLVFLSGVAEIVLGIGLCFGATQKLSAYGIMLMLVVFLPVHFYMLSNEKAAAGLPKWVLVIRIPLQFALIYWAHSYSL